MAKYKGIVKWNGNHYNSGEEVIGSEIRITYDTRYSDKDELDMITSYYYDLSGIAYCRKMYLYDDEPINEFPYYGEARNEWIEIESFEKIED